MFLSALSNRKIAGANPEVAGLSADSRRIRPGWLFAAMPGGKADGRNYINDAIAKGASAILAPKGTQAAVPVVESDNVRRDLALMAARFYGAQPDMIAAVTGTNGKTSTAHFTQQIWAAAGFRSASLGTIGIHGAVERAGSMTTPDPVALHETLAELVKENVTHLAMEASSHGLEQSRLDGVHIQVAGFTNLTRDHLDYHGTMDSYFAAKARLFDLLAPEGVAVLNADVPQYEALRARCGAKRVVSYGVNGADLRLLGREPVPQGQRVQAELFGKRHDFLLPLVGSFMLMNALCAYGMAGVDQPGALEKLIGAPGRLQVIPGHPKGAAVYVDYAHTPDALARVLEALRPHTQGKLVCVFGCGGDRDPGKRPMMGGIAAQMADRVIVTDDNPRSENPASIRAAIMQAIGPGAIDIGDRRKAIAAAIYDLQAGDVLVIAGKGHEQGQIFADRTDPFDDCAEAAAAIASLSS